MESSLRERLGQRVPIRDVDRVASGSPARFVLRQTSGGLRKMRTVDAMLALVRRGASLLRAKRAVEAVMEEGRAIISLPTVEDGAALVADLAAAGITSAEVLPPDVPDVRELRERLDLTREEFATRFGIEVETLRNWETGKREPDTTARSYLRVIANAPELVERAYAPTP